MTADTAPTPQTKKPGFCGGCSKDSTQLSRCAGCTQQLYCSKECQKKDWPRHKNECRKMRNADGNAPKKSNPVITVGRTINMEPALSDWIDWVLIASLDLVNHPERALTQSVSLVSKMDPAPGSAPNNGKQSMVLQVGCTQNQDGIEPECIRMMQQHKAELARDGRFDMTKLIWVVYHWHPYPLPNVLHHFHVISPEKLRAFAALKVDIPLPYIPPFANAAQKYVHYLNHQLLSPRFAAAARTNVVLSDFKDARDRLARVQEEAFNTMRKTGKGTFNYLDLNI
ncbi:hypothetical protein CYLTODRAFT_444511 [Cylindrobasidium torrendii FP15055 ss-10]|uniref:MYND-type domain-containing protein n=1 Tax=Cylindrobasidium torrendii FP15055 ss-10 TaxID=1314674 RepID=A0A0D7B933_9AGAR|nr:hypothetical protein CYLTODRAFT_444511 [Cylindrobasidium torrendii FP15055 ss-10]